MIKIEEISKEFKEGIRSKKIKALDDLSLEVHKGEVFGFLGPNGAGKSTAIKILVNLIRPDKGKAFIMDRDVNDTGVRKHIGYLPENPYFYDYLTAEELLWFGGKTTGLSSLTIKQRADELFQKVNLQGARKRQLRTYSKGMVQRAGLALSLIHDPDVAILDEPMSGLDPLGRKMVGDIILELKARGKTVFFSSHILTDIERFCDRVGIIVAGRLRLVDRLDNLLIGENRLEDTFLREVEKAGGGMET
ncbi:MAG TPA: ABC transporter ATP-binding protein [Nitrospirota bacterium]|nr:ABC transporter ATP-binding protein [Nitrospirota bacterium]